MLLQGLQDKSLKYVTTRLSYVVRENNEDLTKLGCDNKSRSQQEVILGQGKGVATRDMMRRERKSVEEGSCRDIVLYVATLKEDNSCRDRKNDVVTRNDSFIN